MSRFTDKTDEDERPPSPDQPPPEPVVPEKMMSPAPKVPPMRYPPPQFEGTRPPGLGGFNPRVQAGVPPMFRPPVGRMPDLSSMTRPPGMDHQEFNKPPPEPRAPLMRYRPDTRPQQPP